MNSRGVKLALIAVAAAALAAGGARAEATSAFGSGPTRLAACQSAKSAGEYTVSGRGRVEDFGSCECEDAGTDGPDRWSCGVDVYYRPSAPASSYGYTPYSPPAPSAYSYAPNYGYGYSPPTYDPCLDPAAPPPTTYVCGGPYRRDSSTSARGIK
ncbi:hypothetical protein [Caulobacter sp. 17J80-11]|uniref:hypothetical protein n=1 Tax=Caulobacter sp. 17J80-11 TaxID=2763502 RepID=UPI0016537F5C|nr:hypothetical protein [Caulobacter sp. 17J80-11]MBC6981314.1 hypothetical protein [Caulobacter sp. 17J80-11]